MHGIHRIWEHTLKSILRCRVAGVTSELKQALSRGTRGYRLSSESCTYIQCSAVGLGAVGLGVETSLGKPNARTPNARTLRPVLGDYSEHEINCHSPNICMLRLMDIENDFLSSPDWRIMQMIE